MIVYAIVDDALSPDLPLGIELGCSYGARSDRRPRTQYRGHVRLERILETVLYYSSGQEEELARFYGEVLGLRAVGRGGLTFRVGEGLLLLFDAEPFVCPVATPSTRCARPGPHLLRRSS